MSGTYCANCGATLDEVPSLLPEQRSPCPRCGSLARRFEQDITDQVGLTDSGSATETISVTRTRNIDAVLANAATAEARATAFDPTVRTRSQEPRIIKDHLVVIERYLRWTQLSDGTWMTEVTDEAGHVLDSGVGDDQEDALLGVAEALLPSQQG